MSALFKAAEKKHAKLRLALIGPAGSGKTYSALAVAVGLGARVAVVDTEHGSSELYADKFGFDVLKLESFEPKNYVDALRAAEAAGYDVVVIDSLSHAWIGKGGALEQVDNATRKSGSKNSYFAWREVTPQHNDLVEAILQCKCHVIATMRSKTEYIIDQNDKGKTAPRKVGMAPIQREGLEYEFTIVGEMDLDHYFNISKTRCSALTGKVIQKPGADLAKTLLGWLNSGAPAPKVEAPAAPSTTEASKPEAVAAEPKANSAAWFELQFNRCPTLDQHAVLREDLGKFKDALSRADFERAAKASREAKERLEKAVGGAP